MQPKLPASPAGEMRRPRAEIAALVLAGIGGWTLLAWITLRYLALSRDAWQAQPLFIHYDWHAYAAGAQQLGDRTLYRVPLSLGEVPLPLDTFNLPPLAAAEAAPFLLAGMLGGGLAWQTLGAGSVAVAAWALASLTRTAVGWGLVGGLALGGIGIGLYLLVDHVAIPDPQSYWWGLALGTNNYLVLGMLAGFVLAWRQGRERTAGVLLGLAIATKLWPITIAAALVRTRSWSAMRWAAGVAVVQGAVFVAWLGPDVVPDLAGSLLQDDPAAESIIGIAALRDLLPWWPAWAGWAVALGLLALPVRGLVAIGVAMLAGLAAITNLWGHYLPTVVFAVGVVLVGWVERRRARDP